MATTPLDQDAINPNFLDVLANLQTRVENLERQAASGLFDGDEMRPPAGVTVTGGNLQVVGNRGIFRSFVNLGSEIILTISSEEITVTQSYHRVAAETGVTEDLVTINGGIDGDLIILIADTGDTITIRETGNITTLAGSVAIDQTNRFIAIYNASTGKWVGDPH